MQSLFLTLYVLMWPAIAAVVLAVISTAFIREIRQAKREDRDLI